MVLNHLAAIFFFSGPFFYIGLVLAAFPSTIAWLPELIVRRSDVDHRRIRRALRFAGFGLLAGGILLALVG
jgi:hypothetical protein